MRVLFFRFLIRQIEQASFPPIDPAEGSIMGQSQPIQVSGLKYKTGGGTPARRHPFHPVGNRGWRTSKDRQPDRYQPDGKDRADLGPDPGRHL